MNTPAKIISINPHDGSVVGEIVCSTEGEIEAAVQSAREALAGWREIGLEGRTTYLSKVRDCFEEQADEIAELISRETGKVLSEATSEVTRYCDELTWFLENSATAMADEVVLDDTESTHTLVYEPVGVIAAIAPWNFPFGMAIWGIFPALVVGNTVVFKTSEECPIVGKKIEEIIKSCNLPAGVFDEVYGAGEVGSILTDQHIDMIWFTGSTRTGRALYKKAADKFIRVVLEMGGSNPCIIFDDVDPAAAAAMLYAGRFTHNGQICTSLKRAIVHENIKDQLIIELKKLVESSIIGDPLADGVTHGSLVAKRQQELLQIQIQDALDKGALVVAERSIDNPTEHGAHHEHLVLDIITKDMKVWHEEVFGPVLPIVSFTDELEAVELANDTLYGLGARVISKDLARAHSVASRIQAGSVAINYEKRFAPNDPFGGYKLSGIGRERGLVGLRELCQIKVIQESK